LRVAKRATKIESKVSSGLKSQWKKIAIQKKTSVEENQVQERSRMASKNQANTPVSKVGRAVKFLWETKLALSEGNGKGVAKG